MKGLGWLTLTKPWFLIVPTPVPDLLFRVEASLQSTLKTHTAF